MGWQRAACFSNWIIARLDGSYRPISTNNINWTVTNTNSFNSKFFVSRLIILRFLFHCWKSKLCNAYSYRLISDFVSKLFRKSIQLVFILLFHSWVANLLFINSVIFLRWLIELNQKLTDRGMACSRCSRSSRKPKVRFEILRFSLALYRNRMRRKLKKIPPWKWHEPGYPLGKRKALANPRNGA